MKPKAIPHRNLPAEIQQEILLFTGTSLTRQQLCPIASNDLLSDQSPVCQLEQLAWSGILSDIIPELASHALGWKLFLWQVLPGEHSVWICQGTTPQPVEIETSIDPYSCLLSMSRN
jgi:hypothetical protein